MSTRDGVAVARAVADLRTRVLTGELAPGQAVRQEETAQLLSVSRAPVREALRLLADQGLLEHRTHVGYFVKQHTASELHQIYVMLEFLETRVMETIEPATDEALRALRELNREMATFVDAAAWAPMVDLNRRFHFEIFRLSPLDVIVGELERLWTIAAPFIAQKYVTPELRRQSVDEHDELVAALDPFDRERATELLADHRGRRGASAGHGDGRSIDS